MKRTIAPFINTATLALTLLLATTVWGSPVYLDVSGKLSSSTVSGQLGSPDPGVPLADNTPFSYHATFDTTNIYGPGGTGLVGYNLSSLTFNLAGDIYPLVPIGNLIVALFDPTGPFSGMYGAGLVSLVLPGGFMLPAYSTASPSFLLPDPAPFVLKSSDYLSQLSPGAKAAFLLNETTYLAQITFATEGPTTTFGYASPVPEPSTYLLVTLGLGMLLFVRQKKTKDQQRSTR